MSEHPSHYFIKYLLVLQDDLSLEAINSTLYLHGMGPVSEALFGWIQTEVRVQPEDFSPWDRAHAPSSRWLRAQKIFSLLHPDEATLEMKDCIVQKPRLRSEIESLLLGNVSPKEAAYRLRKRGDKIGEVAIAEYRHYFWNTEIMRLSDWADYFATDADDSGTGRTSGTQTAFQAALNGGAEVALYRLGIKRELDSKQIMTEVQAELYHTFLEVKSLPLSYKKVSMLSALARSLARIDERVQAGDTALQDVLKKFEKFKVLTDDSKVPSLLGLAPTGTVSSKSRAEILATKEER